MSQHFTCTAEVRWFLEGQMPEEIKKWFKEENHHSYEERTDTYLTFPIVDTCGAKIREGHLEIKAKEDKKSGHSISFGPLQGLVEFWEKFSSDQAFDDPSIISESLLEVGKKRYCTFYKPDKGILTITDPEADFNTGCQFECVELEIINYVYWSVGFESFTEVGFNFEIITKTSLIVSRNRVFKELNEKGAFSNETTASYPQFLKRFTHS